MKILQAGRLRGRALARLFLIGSFLVCTCHGQSSSPGYSREQLSKAAGNIVRKVDRRSGRPILIVASKSKRVLAEQLLTEMENRKVPPTLLLLGAKSKLDPGSFNLFIDGSAYGGPPARPIALKIRTGRAISLSELDQNEKQQQLTHQDRTKDETASMMAEFGLGINTGANPQGELMEAEQARGTCHFGFGHNLEYGGQNRSQSHVDYVLLRPNIWVDGICICRDGKYLLRDIQP